MSKIMEWKGLKWFFILGYLLVCAGLIAACRFGLLGTQMFGIGSEGISDYLTVISIHFTTVFLTTTLMSTLGAEKMYVYYEDIVQKTLLAPVNFSFRDLSTYAFLTLFTSVIAYPLRNGYVIFLSALVGTAVVIWIFFKMIGIYFGKEHRRLRMEKQMQELGKKGLSNEEYVDNVQKLYRIIVMNLREQNLNVEAFAENMVFLIDLYIYYSEQVKNEESGEQVRKRWDMTKLLLDMSIAEMKKAKAPGIIYPGLFMEADKHHKRGNTERKPQFKNAEQKRFLELIHIYFAEGIPDEKETKNLSAVMVLGRRCVECLPFLEEMLEDIMKQGIELDGEYTRLAQETFWMRILANVPRMTLEKFEYDEFVDMDMSIYDFCDEINQLIECDEERISRAGFRGWGSYGVMINPGGMIVEDPDTGEEKEEDAEYIWWYPARVSDDVVPEEMKGSEDVFDMDDELRKNSFTGMLPQWALSCGTENALKLMKEFFDGYRLYFTCKKDTGHTFEYDHDYREIPNYCNPVNKAVYERMRIYYLQGCVMQVMKGADERIARLTAEQLVRFWEEVKFCENDEKERQQFYKTSFAYIGNCLISADGDRAITFLEMLKKEMEKAGMNIREIASDFSKWLKDKEDEEGVNTLCRIMEEM